jgi:hypothetical protein
MLPLMSRIRAFVISGFSREVDENYALPVYYAARVGNSIVDQRFFLQNSRRPHTSKNTFLKQKTHLSCTDDFFCVTHDWAILTKVTKRTA